VTYGESGLAARIPRFTRLPAEEFFEQFYFMNRPAVIDGLLDETRMLMRWSPEYFAQRFGEVEIEYLTGRDADESYEENFHAHKARIILKDYVSLIRDRGLTNDFYAAGRNLLLHEERLRGLLEEMDLPTQYFGEPSARKNNSRLWFGPAGTVTPLHHDRVNMLFGQVYGRKRFVLIPSFEIANMYNNRDVYSMVDATMPDLERFPKFGKASKTEITLNPGDVLFIPVGWWHWVMALDVSISFSFHLRGRSE
jgi:ribosomal protein L16 Arg81 hydroxylase